LNPHGDREPVAGEVPNPIDPPRGCAFHPRCPYANDRCGVERPSLLGLAGAGIIGWAPEPTGSLLQPRGRPRLAYNVPCRLATSRRTAGIGATSPSVRVSTKD